MFNNFMHLALEMAEKAFLEDEVPVGAVIVNSIDNKIISSGYNLVEHRKEPTSHAEMIVIQEACRIISSKSLENFDLYVTLQPCAMCMQAIIYAKIKRIYFGAYNFESSFKLDSQNHYPEIYGGIEEDACKKLINNFFASKRV